MLDAGNPEHTPAAIRKHIGLVKHGWDGDVVYVCPSLTAYNRKRLVEQKVPFIVPGNQMYLPTLGIDFREHFRRLHEEPDTLSPSAQALLLHVMLRAGRDALAPKGAAKLLEYSAMTMTRAFNELESTRLVEVSKRGKERQLRLVTTPQKTWRKAQDVLRSPVKRRLCIRRLTTPSLGFVAGLTALAECTMLAPPARPSLALSGKDWLSMRAQSVVAEIPHQDPEAMEIEVWSYSPALFTNGPLVDPLSLYLSLRDTDDERVEASLEELMETVKW